LVSLTGSKLTLVDFGVIKTPAKIPLPDRLLMLSQSVFALLRQFTPSTAAVEELFFNTNTSTALSVAQCRGVILLKAKEFGLTVSGYTPLQVKQSVCGYGRAEKQQVQYMVKKLLNMSCVPKPDDAADALAIAICHSHSTLIQSYI
jgi:crossover junction endodeoxyribonuclease RuvC